MAAPSTKQKLLGLLDDVEIITKELFETLSTKGERTDTEEIETEQLLKLLIKKDKDVQETMKRASEQAEVQKQMDTLHTEVKRRDQEILQLQKNLKEAESLLSTAIYQAKQKLSSIHQAGQKAIPSEELIKYAHKISASNAVAAPSNWVPGDPRRPYPTDLEMRLGFLGKVNDLPMPGQGHATQINFGDSMTSRSVAGLDQGAGHGVSHQMSSSLSWQPPPELSTSIQHTIAADNKGQNKENEDVEIMSDSPDSSSSSSSDE